MKIILIGLPYFRERLTKLLHSFDNQNKYISINTATNFGKMKYLWNILNSNLVYSIGGSVEGSRAISCALRLGKKVVVHWVGTDVLNAVKTMENSKFKRENSYIGNVTHYCEVEWIQKELQDIGIQSKIVPIAIYEGKNSSDIKFPRKFSILSYVSNRNPEFYGIKTLIQLAVDFPDIEIRIVGIDALNEAIPSNMKLLGWVNNITEEYSNSIIFLRIVKHDGLAFSVIEALSNGRYVGYTYPFVGCFCVYDYSDLIGWVEKLYSMHKTGVLHPNYKGIEITNKCYKKERILGNLVSEFSDTIS
ncbi:MAG: hypothetical protein NT072_12230 [Deltaproteobacteria bacterium]|nr:hypothetical protein [Deltaproteobacteria bacterium]